MTEENKNEEHLHKCPFCKEAINASAIRCKHCGSSMPYKPRHDGTCPFCSESIDIEATKCKHCKSFLLPLDIADMQDSQNDNMISFPNTYKIASGSLERIWNCWVRVYCEDNRMYKTRCCRGGDGLWQCYGLEQVGNCNDGGKYEMGGFWDNYAT